MKQKLSKCILMYMFLVAGDNMNYVLNVPDMSCQHCVSTIDKALKELGIREARIDLGSKSVSIKTDKIDPVIEKLKENGYEAIIK